MVHLYEVWTESFPVYATQAWQGMVWLKGGLGRAEMCVMAVAVADAMKILFGYVSEAAKLCAAILLVAWTM